MCSHCGRDHRPGITVCPVTGLAMSEPGPCGTTIDRYEVIERIGHGGFGTVYRARHIHTLRDVALKLLSREVSDDEGAIARFRREAQVVTSIRSPHVVEVYDSGVMPDGQPFLVMELLDGSDLSSAIDEAVQLPPLRALNIADQLLSGLAAVHAAGAIHRDLKPSNIFLARDRDDREVVKLLDFGCCRARDKADDRLLMTRTGATIGTPLYMAPEQLRAGTVDVRSDVYSAAVVVFELLSGKRPFEGASYEDLVAKVCTEEPRSLTDLANLPPHVVAAVMRGLERNPDRRWASAEAFARALRNEAVETVPVKKRSAVDARAATRLSDPDLGRRAPALATEKTALAATGDAIAAERARRSDAELGQRAAALATERTVLAATGDAVVQAARPSTMRRYAPLAAVLVVGVAAGIVVPRVLSSSADPAAPPPSPAVASAEPAHAPPPPPSGPRPEPSGSQTAPAPAPGASLPPAPPSHAAPPAPRTEVPRDVGQVFAVDEPPRRTCSSDGECPQYGCLCKQVRHRSAWMNTSWCDKAKCQTVATSCTQACKDDGGWTGTWRVTTPIDEADCKAAPACKSNQVCLGRREHPNMNSGALACVKSCRDLLSCRSLGLCSDGGGDKCVAASEADCALGDECKQRGRCTAQNGECVVGGVADCQRSEACTKSGECTAADNHCVTASSEDCMRSTSCTDYGYCTAVPKKSGGGLKCVVSDEGCAGSTGCTKDQRCHAVGDRCGYKP